MDSKEKVFISYSRKDIDFVKRLYEDLKRYCVPTWLVHLEVLVGDSIIEKISKGIEENDYIIIVLSQNSISSEWVKLEMNAAIIMENEQSKNIILPIIIEDCDIPLLIRHKRYADFREDYAYGFNNLLKVLNPNQQDYLPDFILSQDSFEEETIDTSFLFAKHSKTTLKNEVIQELENKKAFPYHYKYYNEEQLLNILMQLQDFKNDLWMNSIKLFTANVDVIANEILNNGSDVITLASANGFMGVKDLLLLKGLLSKDSYPQEIYYIPVMDHIPLVMSIVKKVLKGITKTEKDRLKIKSILADAISLNQFKQVLDYPSDKKVVCLLNNAMGQYRDDGEFLNLMSDVLNENDYLIIDVLLNRNLSFSSNYYTINDRNFPFADLIGLYKEENHQCQIQSNISSVPHTNTIVESYHDIQIGNNHYDEIELRISHRYSPHSIISFLNRNGYRLMDYFIQKSNMIIICQKLSGD